MRTYVPSQAQPPSARRARERKFDVLFEDGVVVKDLDRGSVRPLKLRAGFPVEAKHRRSEKKWTTTNNAAMALITFTFPGLFLFNVYSSLFVPMVSAWKDDPRNHALAT